MRTRLRRTVLFVAYALSVTIGVATVFRTSGHGGGDPGGVILKQLARTAAALPSDAMVAFDHRDEPHWDSCDGMKDTFGWSAAAVQIHFASASSESKVLQNADRAMQLAGWQGIREGWWSMRLANGTTATASLQRQWYDGKWTLVASAPGVGQQASGC